MLIKVFRTVVGVAVLCSAMTFTAQARDYNDGFLAAEGGDFKSAVDQWGPLAEQGHAIAQFNLALLYHGGLGVDLNEATAVSWYKKSASNGYYKAQEYLAVGYREGWFGLPKDPKQAAIWEKRLEENTR
ncbi:tetratricopeptide repeat protein [Kaarinaea lacus]